MQNKSNLIWTEKYRPNNLNQFTQDNHIKKFINYIINNNNLPNILFSGPSGTGKSSSALLICKNLIKNNDMLLCINASDEKDIKTIRNKIKTFANFSVNKDDEYKIILLDEADSLSIESQLALKKIIDLNISKVRFIFICNYVSKIIDSLQSRLIFVRFGNVPYNKSINIIKQILKYENHQLNDDLIDKIYFSNDGDLRKIINILQNITSNKLYLNQKMLNQYNIEIQTQNIIIDLLNNKKKLKMTEINNMVKIIYNYSDNSIDIIKFIFQYMRNISHQFTLIQNCMIISQLNDINNYSYLGCNDYCQLLLLFTSIYQIINNLI